MTPRKISEDDPILNGVSAPVELQAWSDGLVLSEIQISINVIKVPGFNGYVVAADFADILERLLTRPNTIAPTDYQLCTWLLDNLCKRSHDPRKLELKSDARDKAEAILNAIRNPPE